MQNSITYGARTAANAFDQSLWHSNYWEEKNLKIVKALNWSEHKRRYMVLIGIR